MSWRHSIDDARRSAWLARAAGFARPGAGLAAAAALVLLAACASGPRSAPEPSAHGQAQPGPPAGAQSGTAPAQGAAAGAAPATPGANPNGAVAPPPARAVADFGRAVNLMRSGSAVEAELEFEQIATSYPQLAAPDIDLGLLYRKSGDLDRSERALRQAVERDAGSAVGWCELGVTLRMRGKFHDAEDAYKRAITADPGFAPAYRNLGVLLDLYMGDAPGALEALQHYQTLTGEKEPVRGWIAELRRRAGKSPTDHGAAGSAPGGAARTAGAGPETGKTGD